MALDYTKNVWVNGSAPALNSTNLGHMENGIKAASDALDTMSLDNIADGTTYAKTLAAVAAALNAGTYDAAKCTAFGIGGVTLQISSFAANLSSGLYDFTTNATNAPTSGVSGSVVVLANASADRFLANCSNGYAYRGSRAHGAGTITWEVIWTPTSDGNGGQPPAPKPNDTTTAVGFVNGYAALGRVTPNISGAVYDVFGFSSSGGFLFRQAGIAANYDCININGNCAVIAFYRTV